MADFVKKGLAFASISTDRDNFVIKLLMWNSSDKSLSRVTTKYCSKLAFFLSILASFVKILIAFFIMFWFYWIYYDYITFR